MKSLLFLLGLGCLCPGLDELDGVDSEGLPEVVDDPELGHEPALVELGQVRGVDGDLVSGEVEGESLRAAEVHLDDGVRLRGIVLHDLLDGEGVLEVLSCDMACSDEQLSKHA